jgi:Mechanosensitive ion channel, conserved TM helix
MWEQAQQALNQSSDRVIAGLANLLPGLVALVVALALSSVAAWLLAFLLRRFLRGIRFDERLEGWGLSGLADWSPNKSPSALVTRTVSWLVVLIGFLIGIAAFDATITSEIAMRLFRYLPNVVAAVTLFLVGNVLARFLARGVLISAVNHNLQYARLLSLGVKWLVLVLAAAMALEHLGIGGRIVELAFGILFGGIVLALALAVGLGSKDLVSRSLERQVDKVAAPEEAPEPFRHV